MDEVWKKVKDYKYFEVSDFGRVREVLTKKIIPQMDNGNGYQKVTIPTNTIAKANNQNNINYYYDEYGNRLKGRGEYVHRLVALAFIPNPDNKPQVDHINTDKADNRLENLRWVTNGENTLNPVSMAKRKATYSTQGYKDKMHTALSGEKNGANTHPEKNIFINNNPSYKGMTAHNKGLHWYNNGIINIQAKECPEGYVLGRLKE